jgi:hypothetical protein
VKTTKYRKWCFDQIESIAEDNKLLTAELEHLRKRLETAEKDQMEIESQRLSVVLPLGQKERERVGNLSLPRMSKYWSLTLTRADVSPKTCCRLGGGGRQASSRKHTHGRGVCLTISGEHSVGRRPRTTPRLVNKDH